MIEDIRVVDWSDRIPTLRRNITLWEAVKIYCNNTIGNITRSGLMQWIWDEGIAGSANTIDTYRNYLYKAGYLKRRRFGRYELVKEIPVDLSTSDVKDEAYGFLDRNGNRRIKLEDGWSIIEDMYGWGKKIKKPKDFLKEDEFKVLVYISCRTCRYNDHMVIDGIEIPFCSYGLGGFCIDREYQYYDPIKEPEVVSLIDFIKEDEFKI